MIARTRTLTLKRSKLSIQGGYRLFSQILSHHRYANSSTATLNGLIESFKANPPSCGVDKAIELVTDLSQFELGKFMMANKGWNGRWTSYAIRHASKEDRSTDQNGKKLSVMEDFILNRMPLSLATQERFEIFQDILQDKIENENVTQVASIPCGVMDDILHLDFSSIQNNINVTGIDLDENSLELAKNNYDERTESLKDKVKLITQVGDAWALDRTADRWDLITSNGLNIYVNDYHKTTDLYKSFAKCLKPGGLLLTSFVVPLDLEYIYDKEDASMSMLIFGELVSMNFANYRSEDETMSQLKDAGFDIELIQYDGQRLFPTVLAKRRI